MVTILVGIFLFLASGVKSSAPPSARETSRFKTGDYSHGSCVVQGHYARDMESFNPLLDQQHRRLGTKWEERCRRCSCNPFGAWCTGPTCRLPYDFSQEHWCLRWSEDECCCEEVGCSIDGVDYQLGQQFSYGDGNPCLTCTCAIGTSKDSCLRQQCGTYEVFCEGREVIYDFNCCPRYACPEGVVCDVIPDPFPDTPHHELQYFYGHLEPIPVGMTQHYHIDSWNTYVCQCPRGGNATCRMDTYSR